MPQNKDLKRLIRARMKKTGESYTTARAHIVGAPQPTLPDDYEELAGYRDELLRERTGATWPEWVERLDDLGCVDMSHTDIAKMVGEIVDNAWWAQTVTVGYERLKGLREVGQLRTGEYEANKSKTVGQSQEVLFAALTDDDFLARWLPEGISVRHTNAPTSVRYDWPDETRVVVYMTPKSEEKTTVAIKHIKLDSADELELRKQYWGERLGELAELLG